MSSATNQAEPLVTIVVVPRERWSHTARSLESLYANTTLPFKLVYVDSGSPPYVRKYLQAESKRHGFELVRTDHLLYPIEARNLGLQRVTTPYVAYCDNDVLFTPGWLDTMMETAQRTGAWVVGPLVLEGPLEKQLVHAVGDEARIHLDENGVRRLRKRQSLHLQPVDKVRDRLRAGPSDLVEIHAMLVRTDELRKIGGWDDRLTTSHEHLDLCLRVRLAGGTIWFEPRSVVAFQHGPPYRWSDYPFYLMRWGEEENRLTDERLYAKFDVQPDPSRKIQFVTDRRRDLIMEGPLRWIAPLLRRKRDGKYHRFALRLFDHVESWLTRGALRRRLKAIGPPVRPPTIPITSALLGSVNDSPDGGHVVMFHIGRCGSTVLGNLLGQHPLLKWDGEIYEPKDVVWSRNATEQDAVDPLGFMARRIAGAGKSRYGCEIKFYQARMMNLPLESLVPRLDAMGFTHFIILRRRNLLRKVVSSLVAQASRKWHVPAGSVATLQTVRIPVDAVPIDHTTAPLLELLRGYETDLRRIESLLTGRPFLKINYEEHLEEDPTAGARLVSDFLGLPPFPATVHHGRTTPFALREVIENFEEVEAALRGTEFEWMTQEK